MTLHLEYGCTEAEMKEANSLHEHQQFGGGPKWRSSLIMLAVILGVGTVEFLRFKTEIAPKDREWFIILVTAVCLLFLIFKRASRQKTVQAVHAKVSERGIVFAGENTRSEILWSGFSQCLESPNLFVLLNRTKSILYPVPKRAFPDENSRDWFRATANQPRNPSEADDAKFAPGRFVSGNGIGLSFQLGYRDYLSRNITSWRWKGMMLLVMAMVLVIFLIQSVNPPPNAVVPPWKVFLIMISMLLPMLIAVFVVVTLVSWLGEKRHLKVQHLVLTSEGIQFTDQDSSGRLPWDTYKYYQENRWSLFIWHPRGSLWLMFPKRAFASPSELEQFRGMLQANLKPSRFFYL
jgi:hypothetical protein